MAFKYSSFLRLEVCKYTARIHTNKNPALCKFFDWTLEADQNAAILAWQKFVLKFSLRPQIPFDQFRFICFWKLHICNILNGFSYDLCYLQ